MPKTDLENASKYCFRCGNALVQKKIFNHYDSETGEKVYYTRVYCPSMFRYFGHDNRDYNNKGSEIYNYYY